MKSRHKIFLLLALLCLLAGLINYILFQPNIFLLLIYKHKITAISISNLAIKHILSGYFSDAMWCIALCFVVLTLSELNYLRTSEKIGILLLPFITETSQFFGFIRGTFDWYDIFLYLIIILAFTMFSSIFNTHTYEKD